MSQTETDKQLSFSVEQQHALLGHAISNHQFFLSSRAIIQPTWWVDAFDSKIWVTLFRFYEKHKRIPTIPELKQEQAHSGEDNGVIVRLQQGVARAIASSKEFGLDYLIPQLTQWCQSVTFQQLIKDSAKEYNREKVAEAVDILTHGVNKLRALKFEQDTRVDFSNYVQFFDQRETEYANALTLGLETFDNQLLPPQKCYECANFTPEQRRFCRKCYGRGILNQGSLLEGDTTVFLGAVNAGKTTVMITIGTHNVKRQKNVLLLTHEGSPEDIQEKLWMSGLGVAKHTLYELYRTTEGRAIIDRYVALQKRRMTYIPLNKPGLTVEEVGDIIIAENERHISEWGEPFNLVIDDYPAKLNTKQGRNGYLSRRDNDHFCYNYLVQIGLEKKLHMMSAIQSNREGSKVNSGQWAKKEETKRLLRMEDASESFGPMQTAVNVITINRDEEAEANHRVTFLICKSRSSEKNRAVLCKSNYACAISHSEQLGGIAYRASVIGSKDFSDSDKVNELLANCAKKPEVHPLEMVSAEDIPPDPEVPF